MTRVLTRDKTGEEPLTLGHRQDNHQPCLFSSELRRENLYVVGMPNMGKSRLLEDLARQIIYNWPWTGEAFILVDPHGNLVDSILTWLSEQNFERPVTVLDLRRADWTIPYNVLRYREGTDPGVIVDQVVDAVVHMRGQANADSMPLLEQWLGNVVRPLYLSRLTLLEAELLLDQSQPWRRKPLIARIDDAACARDWHLAEKLSMQAFEDQVGSTTRRLLGFSKKQVLRAMLGQVDRSLDFRRVLERGEILLISLATGTQSPDDPLLVSPRDATVLGRLILSDLWLATQQRVKGNGVRPATVLVDEFQTMVTPTIGDVLTQSRGFGLRWVLAHQYPSQLVDGGECGQAAWGAVLGAIANVIAFRTHHPKDLELIARHLFLPCFDPDLVKFENYSTKQLNYKETYRKAFHAAIGQANGSGEQEMEAHGEGTGWTDMDGAACGGSHSQILPAIGNPTLAETTSYVTNHGSALSGNQFSVFGRGRNRFQQNSSSAGASLHPVLLPVFGKELSSRQYRGLDEQLLVAMQQVFTLKQRQAFVRFGGEAPVKIVTRFMEAPYASPRLRELYMNSRMRRSPIALPMVEAQRRLLERQDELKREHQPSESRTAKRRVTKGGV